MPPTVEWLKFDIGILRSGPHHFKHGDPYTIAATVIAHEGKGPFDRSGGTVEFKGLAGSPSFREMRAILYHFSGLGFSSARWERCKSKGVRFVGISLI